MADTILPKPEEQTNPAATFVPTPAPAPTTPDAVGVAAPAAASPAANTSTAPGASSLANPTTAGNNAPTQAKEAIQTLAAPAPLPDAAKTQPAAPAAEQPGAAPVKPAAAGAKGAGVAGTAPAAGGGSTSKSGTTAKTGTDAALDVLAPVNDTISKMLDGEDPIAQIQFNQILTGNGPRNQAVLQGMRMKLQQNNLDGQGAGDALLAMMARDAEFEDGQLRSKVSSESAKRLYDMNVHGFDKAIEISAAKEKQVRDDLANALSNGQLGAAKELFGQVYPGIPFDEAAAKAASPQATANFNSRMKLVDQFVTQGNAEQAKAVFDKLAEDMPEMFGFPNDPAGAKAAMAGVDFKTEAWQNNLKSQNEASAAARTAALQGDQATVSSSIDQLFAKMTPAAVEGIATSAVKGRSLEDINKILTASGMAPVASTDEAMLVDKTKFAKAVKTYDLMKDASKDVVDGMLDVFAKADPAIAIDPAARQAAKTWLSMHAYALATSADGTSTSFDPNKLAEGDDPPPWDPKSRMAYMYMDWPLATFNPDGTMAERSYAGLTPYNSEYKAGDLTTEKGKEDARLDKAYEQYQFSTPKGEMLPMEQWYYATAAGTKPVNTANLTGSMKPDTTEADKAASLALQTKIAEGKQLSDEDIALAVKTKAFPSFDATNMGKSVAGEAGKQYLTAHPDGMFLMNGKLVKLVEAVVGSKGLDGTALEYSRVQDPKTGKIYFVKSNGQFVDRAPANNYKSSSDVPKNIANPFA